MRLFTRTAVRCAAAIAGLVLLDACSSPTQGTPPQTTTGPTTTQASDNGAPTVASPVDASAFQQDPCAVLTAGQLRQLGIDATGKPRIDALGPTCDWHDQFGASKADLNVIFNIGRGGLGATYGSRSRLSYFQPAHVDGFPAVYAAFSDQRAKGICYLYVGLSSQLQIQVGASLGADSPNYHNPCGVAQEVATGMVSTIKAGG